MTEVIMNQNKKYHKPEGFPGRGFGSKSYNRLKWQIVIFDKENLEMRSGKFCTVKELNESMGLNLTPEFIWRLTTKKRVDEQRRNGLNSFLSRYAHIKIDKINEPNPLAQKI